MTQSVELLLDPAAEDVIRAQWAELHDAGLPSEQRTTPSSSHRPHVTLFAADRLDAAAEPVLDKLVRGLDLELIIGAVTVFGPRRGRCIMVRQVIPTPELLAMQAAVADACTGGSPDPHFAIGAWVPHVTLAHRVPTEQLGRVVATLGESSTPTHVTRCRRWDSDRKITWLLGGAE